MAVRPDAKLADAVELMSTYQVRRLPVVDDENHLVGVIAQADIALEAKEKASGEMLEEISRQPAEPRQR